MKDQGAGPGPLLSLLPRWLRSSGHPYLLISHPRTLMCWCLRLLLDVHLLNWWVASKTCLGRKKETKGEKNPNINAATHCDTGAVLRLQVVICEMCFLPDGQIVWEITVWVIGTLIECCCCCSLLSSCSSLALSHHGHTHTWLKLTILMLMSCLRLRMRKNKEDGFKSKK